MSEATPTADELERRLEADRAALKSHSRLAKAGLEHQTTRSVPVLALGAAVVGALMLVRTLLPRRSLPVARRGHGVARATRLMGVATAAYRLWPQLRSLVGRLGAR